MQALASTTPKPIPGEAAPGEDSVAHRYEKPFKRNYDAVSQLEAMDEEGLDVAVLFRTFPLHCDDSLEPEYANDLCRAWNNWMADFCKADPKRLRPSALITLHDVDLAVDETHRAITELGAIGLCLVPEPANGRHIHDRYYDPVWREAEKLGAPICFHPAANPNTDQVVHRFKGHSNEAVLINAFRNPIELMLAVGSFCAGGVLERFPNLRVAFLEGNCSWLPWVLYRLDERWEHAQRLCQRADEHETERLFHAPVFYLRGCRRKSGGRRGPENRRRQCRDLDGLPARGLALAKCGESLHGDGNAEQRQEKDTLG